MIIADFLGKNTLGDVGIEIEVEGDLLPPAVGLWKRERDPSLRGPDTGEYVLTRPIPINNVGRELTILKDAFVKYGSTFNESPRAGVHVHVNVCDLTFKQVITMVCAYIILEEFFIRYCDKSRDGNLFCLPTYSASYLLSQIRQTCEKDDAYIMNTDNIRYASINVNSLFKYGSIEFRSLESTYNFDKIRVWCEMLYKLKVAAQKYADPADLLMSFSKNECVPMINAIMEEHAPMFLKHEDALRVTRGGILRAQDIAFSRDWSSKNLNIFKKRAGVFN